MYKYSPVGDADQSSAASMPLLSPTPMPSKIRKHTTLTIANKLKIIDHLEVGTTMHALEAENA